MLDFLLSLVEKKYLSEIETMPDDTFFSFLLLFLPLLCKSRLNVHPYDFETRKRKKLQLGEKMSEEVFRSGSV